MRQCELILIALFHVEKFAGETWTRYIYSILEIFWLAHGCYFSDEKKKNSYCQQDIKHACVCMLNCFSRVWLFVTSWIVAHQAPLSMGILKARYWSGLPSPSPGDLPNPGVKPTSLKSPALTGRFFTTSATCEAHKTCMVISKSHCDVYTFERKFLKANSKLLWFWGKSSADLKVSLWSSLVLLCSMDWNHLGLPGLLALLPQTRESGFFLPLCPRNPWKVTKLSGALSNIPMDGWHPDQVFLLGWVCHTYTLDTSTSEDIQKLFKKNRQCLVAPEDLALIDWLSKPLWKLQTASWKNGPQSFQETKVVFLIFPSPYL